jgi:hypothetical protein
MPGAAEEPPVEDMEEVVNEEDYGSEEDSGQGVRIDPAVIEELQYLSRNIKEEQFEENFRGRIEKLFADVASLNQRFPPETSHHEGIVEEIEKGLKEQAKMKEEFNQMIVKLDTELRDMHRINTEEREQ